MNLYAIVNPSAAVTFRAENDAVARAAVLVLGNGAYGLHDVTSDDRDVPCLLLFASKETTERLLVEWFGPGSLGTFVNEHWAEVAAALASAQNLGPQERLVYESALAKMTPDAAAKYRLEVEDHYRTSLNEIVKRAWRIAKRARNAGEAVR
jgi:hypothetical protein